MGAILVSIYARAILPIHLAVISLLTFVVVALTITVIVVEKVGSRWEGARRRRHSNWSWATCRRIYQFTEVISAVH